MRGAGAYAPNLTAPQKAKSTKSKETRVKESQQQPQSLSLYLDRTSLPTSLPPSPGLPPVTILPALGLQARAPV